VNVCSSTWNSTTGIRSPASPRVDDGSRERPGPASKRGELRIYLGAAPGVGKTFAMLGEAHRRLERGTDLVAAVVETHGRRKTAEMLEGIEIIPPRYIEYRGGSFPELDVSAVLARHPQVVLVDELAHTIRRAARTKNVGRTSKSCSTRGSP